MNFNRAFTLAEVILVLAIVGIISVMGITTMNMQTERAYNIYYRTGYIALYDAFSDAVANEYFSCDEIVNHAEFLFAEQNAINEPEPANLVIDDIPEDIPAVANIPPNRTIEAKNNISYSFGYNNEPYCQYINVTMSVPAKKTRANRDGRAEVNMTYYPHTLGGLLVPDMGSKLNRREVLPCYIDDGIVGRVYINNGAKTRYTQEDIVYSSYQDAFCSGSLYRNSNIIPCAGAGAGTPGVIKFKRTKNKA